MTAFVIEQGIYCYKIMPLGFKNARIIYQLLVNMMIKKHIGVTMEVYINDIMVKVKRQSDHIGNLAKTFNVNKYKLKLNLMKWMFRVYSARFLGYLVTQREIKAYSKQIEAILDMKSPSALMEI